MRSAINPGADTQRYQFSLAAQDRTPTETWNSEDSGPFPSLVTVQDSLPEPVQKNW